jgi:hypothetical protein
MSKLVFGIAAALTLLIGISVTAMAQAEPIHHGWDGWWHDLWHSGWAVDHGWLHHDCHTMTVRQRLPDGQMIARTAEWC